MKTPNGKTVYKSVYLGNIFSKRLNEAVVLEMILPDNAKKIIRKGKKGHGMDGRKCRADQLFIVRALDRKTQKEVKIRFWHKLCAHWDNDYTYKIGTLATPKYSFNEDEKEVCASGMHFFLKIEDAINYY